MAEITLSRKQHTAFELLQDPRIVELLFGGGAGGGKSLLVALWMIIECRKYPGITIGLGRKEISNLRKTTALTILTEAHPMLGVYADDFRYSSMVDPGIYYRNNSAILFIDLAPAPSDPNFDRLGSLNLTHNVIEEAGEITHQARSVFSSRKNRKLNEQYAITGKTILTCNPSQNFVRDEFYEPYLALGAGDYQTWDHGQVIIDGQANTAKRAFVKSLPTDNPFLSLNYIETLRNLPDTERRRLMEGDWDYNDDDALLFKTHLFRVVERANGDKYAGCDPSRGGDATVFSLIEGNVVTDLVELAIPKDARLDKGDFVAKHFIEFCQSRGVGYDHAAFDVVGIGASVQDALNRRKFYAKAFNAGSTDGVRMIDRFGQVVERKVTEGVMLFNNVRSQTYYDMAEAAHSNGLFFLDGLPHYGELKRDLGAHKYETKERQTIVESKDKIKARLGKSPDFSDALMAAYWCKTQDGRNEPRVRFI